MFERFTDRARRVLVLAQEEARLLQHNFIGTEHILLGLIHEGEGVAARALESLGVSLPEVRALVQALVQETIGPGDAPVVLSPPFTPRSKKLLELSLREALQLGHNYIGTEHMLLGLVREGEGVAAQVLTNLGHDLSTVRQVVLSLLGGHRGGGLPGVDAAVVDAVDDPLRAVDLVTAEEAAELLAPGLEVDAGFLESVQLDGVTYETWAYRHRQPLPELSVSVAGARVGREAFDAFTREKLPEAEVIEGLGDAATYDGTTRTLRALQGTTLIVVAARHHVQARAAAVAAARLALAKLAAAGDEA